MARSTTQVALEAAAQEMERPAAVCLADGTVVFANAALAQLTGEEAQALDGRPIDALVVPAGLAPRERVVGEGDDARRLYVFAPTAQSVPEAVQGLLEAEERYRRLFTWERDALSVVDTATGRFVEVNEAWEAQYGYTREDALAGMSPVDVSAEPLETLSAVAETASSGGRKVTQRWHRRKDGTVFPVEITCGSVEVGGRRLVYSMLRDISDRVETEEALRRSESSFRSLIEGLPHGVMVVREGGIVYVNPALCQLLGYAAHELLGTEPIALVHEEDLAAVNERGRIVMHERQAVPLREERFVRADGVPVTVETAAIPVDFGGAPAGLAILQDVRARKQMESQLVTADRLAALGRLAAAIGHEINNPLAYVMGNVQLARRSLARMERASDSDVRQVDERLSLAEEGAGRVRDIVRDLKTLTHAGDDEQVGPVDLQRLIDVCADMADPEIRYRARLVRQYDETARALGNEARLGQVFLNLLVNAGQAISEGHADENEVTIRTGRADDGQVEVEIRDTGAGIPPEIAERIFEPFVTSKPQGGGTGLGLSICHHIVTSLGGSIEFRPNEPQGTRFVVRLPAATEEEQTQRSEGRAESGRTGGRILIVDDEPQVGRLLGMALEGYEIEIAHSGREALEKMDGDAFDVILCDLMMSDMGGIEVYEQLAQRNPGVERRIIFMTGGAFTPRAQGFLEAVDNPCLDKPFDLQLAQQAVHDVVSRDQTDR